MPIAVGHWTVVDYDRAVERGTFGPEPRIELLRGEIYEVSPTGPRHANTVRRLRLATVSLLAEFVVGSQEPIVIPDHSEPEPDLWIAKPGDYSGHHPTPAELLLVVEVSESTLGYDLETKVPLYLEAGIPCVLIVDLVNNCVHVRSPLGEAKRATPPQELALALPPLEFTLPLAPLFA